MQCPQCNRGNPEGARFCGRCGAKLARMCAECGAEVPPDPEIRFCVECGAEIQATEEAPVADADAAAERLQRLVPKEYAERLLATRGQVQAERRMVTILFSDVKGSTAMAEGLDPEEVMEIMDGAFDVLIEPIYRYEGTLARLMGDAVLAFFGAPIAHEDDPERACRAALGIVEGAKEYAARLEQEHGITGFNVRLGIHTGLVVVGEVGSDLRVEYTAMGDAINLAARLESAADPGTVLITEATLKLIAPLFETEALAPIQVKGKVEPVSVYRVLAAKEVPGKVRGIAGLESPLVGREVELAALQEALQRLQAGVGGIVTLVGEAGIGKSRLVAEARKHVVGVIHELPLRAMPLRWVEGRCLSYGGSVAYLLWLDVLRGLLGVALDDAPQAVGDALRDQVQELCRDAFDDVYPYLARLMTLALHDEVAARLDDMDGRDLKTATFRAVETLIQCAAGERPLVLVCEDLHWADPTSLALLEQLLALTERVPLLLLSVFRPVKDHGCWRFRELAAQTYAERHTDVMLEPLTAVESQTLVANLLRIEHLPEVLRERILSRAEGNPFYVEEVIRSLIDRGAIVHDEPTGRWTATREVADIPIPDTLQGVLVARIDRLQEEAKRVLQMASVIGRIFLYRLLSAIAAEERRLDEHLSTLQHEEMIRERARIPELEYIFKHDLTREAAYNGLLKKQRRVFHRQVAEVLEHLFPERIEEQLGLLAHHWEQSGNAEKAVEYLQRAGDKSRLAYALEEAVGYYQRALALLKEKEEHEQAARTLMKMGLTYDNAFDFRRARQAYSEGFKLWHRAAATAPAAALPPAPHALRILWSSPRSLDPVMAGGATTRCVIQHLFSGLVELTPDLSIVPDVAQSWELTAEGRRYTFYLRDDVVWGDGQPVTAHDFEYAWQRVLDPANSSPGASLLSEIAGAKAFHQGQGGWADVGIKALDESTLRVELEGPLAYFLQLLVCANAYPVPRHVVQAWGEAWTEPGKMVTNGPFCLESWAQNESIALRRNPKYHGRCRGNVQRVELSLLSIEQRLATALGLYEQDGLDVMDLNLLSVQEGTRARHQHAGDCLTTPSLGTFYLAFNPGRSPLDDSRVRQAFALASDRERLADELWRGDRSAHTGGLVPPGMPGHSPEIAMPYDPEQARRLLADAGYAGGRGMPELDALAPVGFDPYVEALAGQWRANLGVEVECKVVSWDDFAQRKQRELPHLWPELWVADYPDPDNFLRLGMRQIAHLWGNRAYDGLVERARRLADQAQRMRLYNEADRMLMQEAVVMPLTYWQEYKLIKPWVSRFPTTPPWEHFWKDVVIEPH